MGETAASNRGLQVSVSFGRFENDSVSWEKWSTFSPNKYLEEVEKCATHGSVAQKKAYFEAHYKKIAARQAELLSQEKETDKDALKSEDEDGEDQSGICRADAEFDASDNKKSIEGIKQETHSFDSSEGDFAVSGDYQISSVDRENKQLECRSDSSQVEKPEEEEMTTIEAQDLKESSPELDKEIVMASEAEPKHVTTGNRKINTAKAKKKPVLPSSNVAHVSSPRSLRSTTVPTKTPAFASSTRKGNSSTGENKRIANKALHMSLSFGPSKPDPSPLTSMRKSSIMEKMGDKEIVKRTFKTFQSINLPKTSGEERSLVRKQIPSRMTEPRLQKSMPLRKENGRPTKADSINKISGNAVRASGSLKSDMRAEKGKEFPKKIEEKSNSKEAERVPLQSKLKEQREAENKKVKHNFKATPLPAFYRAQKVSKNQSEKGNVNPEAPK
ncbi:hypothetical protein K1719_003865 [Acacia pycnantha]|nr:hypothetical protein K1719_003865 [Acacia pycnantha]